MNKPRLVTVKDAEMYLVEKLGIVRPIDLDKYFSTKKWYKERLGYDEDKAIAAGVATLYEVIKELTAGQQLGFEILSHVHKEITENAKVN